VRLTTLSCPVGGVVGQTPSGGSIRDSSTVVVVQISAGPGSTTVPAVVGQSQTDAERALGGAGLHAVVRTTPSPTVPSGQVIATDPRAGSQLSRGSSVHVQVSGGPPAVSAPDVRGQAEIAAAVALLNSGLKVGTVTAQTSDQPPGTVLGQVPAPGSRIAMGTPVNLTVAKQRPLLTVVGVVGLSRAKAVRLLKRAGLGSSAPSLQPVSDPAQNGRVLAQSPLAGQRVPRGTTVAITVGVYSPSTTTTVTTTTATTTTTTATTTVTTTATTATTTPATTTTIAAPPAAPAGAVPPTGAPAAAAPGGAVPVAAGSPAGILLP